MQQLRFLSGNQYKIAEVRAILSGVVDVVPVDFSIKEIQTRDVAALVHDKCIKAFQRVGRPIFVEHTGLEINALNGFPGGLTQVFWDTVQADTVAALFGGMKDPRVTARTTIGYCDGRRVLQVHGEVNGLISSEPRGPRDFQWDCIFVPDGETQTFAEMGERKNDISMRRVALKCFLEILQGE